MDMKKIFVELGNKIFNVKKKAIKDAFQKWK